MKKCYLIDALNVLNANSDSQALLRSFGLESALDSLVQMVTPLHDDQGNEVYLVIDSNKSKVSHQPVFSEETFARVYAPARLTADGLIEQWVLKMSNPALATVVTNDRAIQHSILAAGADLLSVNQFILHCSQIANKPSHRFQNIDKPFNNPFDSLS